MNVKKIPMRTCVVTHEKLPKRELIRIVRSKDGIVSVDESGKMNGKGVYLKKDLSVIEKAQNNKLLNRYLSVEVSDEIYEELKKII